MAWDCLIPATVVRSVRLLSGLQEINASSLMQINRSKNNLGNKFEVVTNTDELQL